MRFEFNQTKAIQTMAYIVGKLNSIQKVKLMKLVYLADRSHFLRCGYPITGDRQRALPYGPVPSGTLDVLNGNFWPESDVVYNFLHVDDNTVMLRHDPGTTLLSKEELETLDEVLMKYANTDAWTLVEQTHALPEYQESIKNSCGRSASIPYELILKHAGGDSHYRLNRPVISATMVGHLLCPLNQGADTDL